MIKLEELKPILEPLLGDNAAEIIEAITAIDRNDDNMVDKSELEKLNSEWNERFKKAFFSPEEVNPNGNNDKVVEEQVNEQADEEETEIVTFDQLFKEGE